MPNVSSEGKKMYAARLVAMAIMVLPAPALARNIVLSNDDGLTGNVRALYRALKAQGHDVIVSVPCTNQSGMGAAIRAMRPLGPLAADCLNGVAKAGEPGAGPMTGPGLEDDFFYVDGTPVMALLYGLDVVAMRRWGKAPDLVLSGPNPGQNVGYIVISSGTVNVAQYAGMRGIPAIALSAGEDIAGNAQWSNPKADKVAALSTDLVRVLDARAGTGPLLPAGIALNVNFPDQLDGARWKASRIGTYNSVALRFSDDMGRTVSSGARASPRPRDAPLPNLPGLIVDKSRDEPGPQQQDDEAAVYRKYIAVSVMQLGYDHRRPERRWLRKRLRGFLAQ
jgi:5'-nucleotidase